MSLYNHVVLIGNVVRDSVSRPFKTKKGEEGTATSFSIAHNRKTNKDSEEVFFVNVDSFGKEASYLKGERVMVEGELRLNAFTDKNGVERKDLKIVANSVLKLNERKKEDNSNVTVGGEDTAETPF